MLCVLASSLTVPLGDAKQAEKDQGKSGPADRRHLFGQQVDAGDGKQQYRDEAQAEGQFPTTQGDIQGHFPLPR